MIYNRSNFDRWFGASCVRLPSGAPQVLYHGSTRWEQTSDRQLGDILVFNRLASVQIVRRSWSVDAIGNWFSSERGDYGAGKYAGPSGVIYPVYVRIENPWTPLGFNHMVSEMHTVEGRDPKLHTTGKGSPEGLRSKLIADGYDGIRLPRSAFKRAKQEFDVAAERHFQAQGDRIRTRRGTKARSLADAKLAARESELSAARAALDASSNSSEFDDQDVWIAFHPHQVKSAIGNAGSYNLEDPRIDR